MTSRKLIGLGAGVLLGALSCAHPAPPTGGEPDREPPYVVSTNPEALAVVPPWDGPVVIRFSERISENGIDNAVVVSPETGELRVRKGRSDLRISLEGGWQPNRIYRIVVLPVLKDLFGNAIPTEIEVVFSTGPKIPTNAVAGLVTDRLTGKPVPQARVEAVHRGDSAAYVALSDSAGFYALRHIPEGAYLLRGYLDQSRNRKLEFAEARDTATTLLGATDTTIVSFRILPSDTTGAKVVRAEARDSMQVRIHLDDYLDPADPLDGVRVRLRLLPDSTIVEEPEVVFPHEFDRRRAREREAADTARADSAGVGAVGADTAGVGTVRPDSVRPDTVRPDTVRPDTVRPDTAGEGAPVASPGVSAVVDTAPPLPTRELVVVPAVALPPTTRYVIEVEGVRNITGIPGGGGSAVFETPAPGPSPDTVQGDTVPPGTIPDAIPPDTIGSDTIPPDTIRPDTIPPDTIPPDTIRRGKVPGDTVPAGRVVPGPVAPEPRRRRIPPDTSRLR